MIAFKEFGKTVKIRNDDWKKMRERFDVDKAWWDGGYYKISTSCPVCDRYVCPNCPFHVFVTKDELGCINFLEKLLKPMHFGAGNEEISWSKSKNKLARKQLGQILKMMDKIEASQ